MHKTFFGKLIATIVTFWVTLFGSELKVEEYLKKHAADGIMYAQIFKNILLGKWVDILKTFTPDNIDGIIDHERARMLNLLDKAIAIVYKGKPCLDLPTLPERIQCIIDGWKESTDTDVIINMHILAIASAYTRVSTEEAEKVKVSQAMADTAVQNMFYGNQMELNTNAA